MSIGSEFRLVDFVKIPALTSFGSCLDAKLFGLNVLHDRISFFFHLLKVLETNVCSWNVLFFFFLSMMLFLSVFVVLVKEEML